MSNQTAHPSFCFQHLGLDPEVMEEMLRFVYTGLVKHSLEARNLLHNIIKIQAPNLKRMADKLLVAADRYQLSRLKVQTENSFANSLELLQKWVELIWNSDKMVTIFAHGFVNHTFK